LIFQALAETDDPSIFEVITIKAMIEQKWPLTKMKVIWWLLLPYLMTLMIFAVYTCYDLETTYEDKQSEHLEDLSMNKTLEMVLSVICRILIILSTTYFLMIEIYQCMKETFWVHFSDFWNYLDIVPPLFIYTAEILNLFHADHRLIRTLYSLTALVMWVRFLYFFRIVKTTNFYIRMIVQVIIDMGQFFFILSIAVLAFGHSFYIFFKNHNIVECEPTDDPTVMSCW